MKHAQATRYPTTIRRYQSCKQPTTNNERNGNVKTVTGERKPDQRKILTA
jgi:hypothetical protein